MATSPINAVIIGARRPADGKRNIGGELWHLLDQDPRFKVRGVLTAMKMKVFNDAGPALHDFRGDMAEFRNFLQATKPEVCYLCVPSSGDGTTAWSYTKEALRFGAVVSTAEKAMGSRLPDLLMPNIDSVDMSASVGGGNRFLYSPKLMHFRDAADAELFGILNSTLNYVLERLAAGISPQEAMREAIGIGIAEPPKNGDPLTFKDLIDGEIADVAMKVCVFYNMLLASGGNYLTPDMLRGPDRASPSDLARLQSKSRSLRMVVRISNKLQEPDIDERDMLLARHVVIGDWYISLGFRAPDAKSPLAQWLDAVPGTNNGVLLYPNGRRFRLDGPGAGPDATASAMIEGSLDRLKHARLLQRLKQGHEAAA